MPRARDRWVSLGLSVLLHGALLGALVYGWILFRRPPQPAPTLAIEATVVDAKSVKGTPQAPPQPPAAPEEVPPEPEGPPPPTAEELEQREQERQQADAAAQEQQAAEQRAAQEAALAEQAAAQRKAEEQRQAEERAEKERKAQEAAVAKQRATQEAEERETEADLRRSLAAEEHAAQARTGPALAGWEAQIAAKINRAWLRPPTARAGIQCVLHVTQVPGGEVTKVDIGECNGDQAVRESIEVAVYRASPLPPPPDPAMFDRNLTINFKPD
ncbi:MAG TPA: cell envelope integrity protein TolA [Steroidobacteraceae bacterium]|jgi:colicin import membrane protein|nr:cell envelope integrity protein TolA [Steroidobacteraceae bacterium]